MSQSGPFTIRHTEPSDFEGIRRVLEQPKAIWGTSQLPYPSSESWRRKLAQTPAGFYSLVACIRSQEDGASLAGAAGDEAVASGYEEAVASGYGEDVPSGREEIVGQLGLQTFPNRPRRKHAGAVGMAVHDEWQGRGAGTALLSAAIDLADNWLGLTRLELDVFTDNGRAIALYEKFGFSVEGTLRRFAFRGGAYVDAYLMARLKEAR